VLTGNEHVEVELRGDTDADVIQLSVKEQDVDSSRGSDRRAEHTRPSMLPKEVLEL
jgi:hypothetical protein